MKLLMRSPFGSCIIFKNRLCISDNLFLKESILFDTYLLLKYQLLFVTDVSFPTPMEEPKKVIRSHYLGSMLVNKPTGKIYFFYSFI